MADLLADALAVARDVVRPRANTRVGPYESSPWGHGAIAVKVATEPRQLCDDCGKRIRVGHSVHVMPDLDEVHTSCAKARLEALGVVVPTPPPLRTPIPPGGSHERS